MIKHIKQLNLNIFFLYIIRKEILDITLLGILKFIIFNFEKLKYILLFY